MSGVNTRRIEYLYIKMEKNEYTKIIAKNAFSDGEDTLNALCNELNICQYTLPIGRVTLRYIATTL